MKALYDMATVVSLLRERIVLTSITDVDESVGNI
jgi:hypothetical protein